MHPYLVALILGIIEGLTEFLPVSSTAHLRVALPLLGQDLHDPFWEAFSVIIQFGAVACLPVYFKKRILSLGQNFPEGSDGSRNIFNHPLTLVLIAFVVTAIPALLLKKVISGNLKSLEVMGWALVIGGVVMWVVDAMFKKGTTDTMEKMSIPQAIWIGAIQILSAVFPGTSRSMSTIAAGQTAGLTRPTALEFSFFVSIPIMFAACTKELLDMVKGKDQFAGLKLTTENWISLGIGFVVSFLVSLVVVHFFMSWVRRRGFVPFAIYRILIGAVILLNLKRFG